jgi:3-hydroxyisobutyrate dehydrogenase-like beta-hydroxyacid dehydrogenase
MTAAPKSGLDPVKVLRAINASSGRRWTSENRFPRFVLAGEFSSRGGMATELMVKDLTNALAGGKEQSVPMPVAGLVQQLFVLSQVLHGAQSPNQIAVRMYEEWAKAESRAG